MLGERKHVGEDFGGEGGLDHLLPTEGEDEENVEGEERRGGGEGTGGEREPLLRRGT